MKKFLFTAFAAAYLASLPSTVLAQQMDPLETALIRDREDVQLDRDKAYLLVQSVGQYLVTFYREPTEAERADWAWQREVELREAIEKYPGKLDRYERAIRRYNTSGGGGFSTRKPERPVEPTEESFAWPDLERYRLVSNPPRDRFLKDEGLSVWLIEVPAGDYVFYSVSYGVTGNCACMGSVSFKVETGTVTGVRAGLEPLDSQGQLQTDMSERLDSNDRMARTGLVFGPAQERAFDPRIPSDMVAKPEFELVPALANWLGGGINRIQPIEGVLEYDRDRMVDLREPTTSEIVIADMRRPVAEEAELAAPEAIEEASIVAAVGAQTETEAPVE